VIIDPVHGDGEAVVLPSTLPAAHDARESFGRLEEALVGYRWRQDHAEKIASTWMLMQKVNEIVKRPGRGTVAVWPDPVVDGRTSP
jgi:hypothetical protein